MLASCDCFGNLFLWDIRGNKSLLAQDLGPHSLNSVHFDPSGEGAGIDRLVNTLGLLEYIILNLCR